MAQLRVINHALELGLGVGFGPTRFGGGGEVRAPEWGYFVDPHLSVRIGRTVGSYASVGLVVRKWPQSRATEFGEHYTTQHLLSDEGCTRGLHLNARPGMTYRVSLEVQSVNQCQLTCTQETVVGGRLIRSTCEDFSPS